MRAHALVVLALAGCNTEIDPCAALVGRTCLAVRARGSMRIDQLELQGVIGVRLPPNASRTPPVAAGAFDLPAVTALDLGDFEGAYVIRVRGLLADNEVGAGLAAGDLVRGQHARANVELRAGEDAAVLDAAGLDLAGSDAALPDLAIPDAAPASDGGSTPGWLLMHADSVGDIYGDLMGIWGLSANNLFIVGENPNGGLVLRGHDDTWTSEMHGLWALNGVWGSSNTNVYVVSAQGTIWHFDGTNWNLSGAFGGGFTAIHGIDASTVYAVGAQSIQKLTVANTNSWTGVFANESGWNNTFYGVWLKSPTIVFAVGYRFMLPSTGMGMVRVSVGSDWFVVDEPGERLNSAWGSSDTDVYAVGFGGTIKHLAGATPWRIETPAGVANLYGVWGSGPGDVYAVGESGTILHRDATTGTWMREASPVDTRLRAVFGVGGVVYAVGDAGVILRKP